MPAVIDKALDFIGGMNTSEPVPQSMDESTAKGILKYLKELGVPATPADVAARGQQQGWSAGFTDKVAEWAERVAMRRTAGDKASGILFHLYAGRAARPGVIAAHPPRLFSLMPSPIGKAFLLLPSIAAAQGFDQGNVGA